MTTLLNQLPGSESTVPESPLMEFPGIENDTDYSDALDVFQNIPDDDNLKGVFGGALADFQTGRVLRDYVDPAAVKSGRENARKMDVFAAMARDWTKEPEARKKVVDAYGEDFAHQYEQSTEKDYIAGEKYLEEFYSREGDGEFDSIFRFEEQNGVSSLRESSDVWKHVLPRIQDRITEEDEFNKAATGFAAKSWSVIEALAQGETFLSALDTVKDWTPEERDWAFLNCGPESEWAKCVQRARQWAQDNQIELSLSEDSIARKAKELEEKFAEDDLHSGGVLSWGRPLGRTQEEWRTKAIEELSSGVALTQQGTYQLAKSFLDLKKKDEPVWDMLVGLYKFHADRERNDGTAFFSPFAQTMSMMLSSAVDGIASATVGEMSPEDSLKVSVGGAGSVAFATYDSSGNAVRRYRDPELIEQMNLIKSMQAEIAESPDGAWWIRRQIDGLGKMAAQTAMFLGTRGMGTFASIANDRYDELRADGHGVFESVLRGGIAGGTEVLVERLGGEFFGRNLRWLSGRVPGMQRVTGYFGGIGDLVRAGMYKNAAFRYAGYSLASGGSEWTEELIQPTMQAPLDSGIALLFGSTDGMSYDDWKQQIQQVCTPDLLFQMSVFGAACGVVQLPGMAREAQISRTGPGAIQALTRCSDERAREIADMVDPVQKRDAIIEEATINVLSEDQQKQNVIAGIANMQDDFSGLKEMVAYQAQVELGNMPRMEVQEDGSWLAYDKVAGTDGALVESTPRQLTEQQALAEVNARMENGIAQQINVIQSNLVARAAVDAMKTTGRFDFETMGNTETAATVQKLAKAARLRLDEGMSPQAVDPSISRYLPLGVIESMPGKVREREAIAQEQGSNSPFASNAYRVALSRSRTLIRFVEGKITTAELMEEAVESYLSEYLQDSGHSIDWASNNLREAQRYLKEAGVLKNNLIAEEGDASLMQVVEAMGVLARGDVMRRIESLNLPQFIKDFLKWARSLFVSAGNLAELGNAFYQLDKAGKLDKTFAQSIYDAAGITQEIWADAAMDATYRDLAMIATRALGGMENYHDIQEGAFRAWNGERATDEAESLAPQETAETLVPNTDHPHDGLPGAHAAAGEYGAIEYVSVEELTLSQDVPQFKEGASSETGEVEPFEKFDERVAPPIHVWRRADGSLEVISGRHRWQARKRDGGKTIMAYVHNEADGFTKKDAEMLDVTLNIKEGQGSVLDWARYIRTSGMTMGEARDQGLLRGRGIMGVLIGAQASEDLFALFAAGKVGEKTASAIAAFPNHDLQRVGIRCVGKRMTAQEIVNVMSAVQGAQKPGAGETMDMGSLFGDDDSALVAAERIGAFATAMQQKIAEKINAVRGAAKRPETARKMGVDVSDPAALLKTLSDLEMQRRAWLNYAQYPELFRQAKGWDGESSLDGIEPALANLGIDMSASMNSTESNKANISFSAAEAQEKGLFRDGAMYAGNAIITALDASFSITARHASPHSFRKFDTEKMGTGEGRQAFGWGVYLTTNRQAHEFYVEKFGRDGDVSQYMVEVNVDDSQLLTWEYVEDDICELLKASPVEEVRDAFEYAEDRADYRGENVSGKGVYKALSDAFWDGDDDTKQDAARQASEALLQSGIKGIRYEDGMSRDSIANKTFNYVVFDSNDIKITDVSERSTGFGWERYNDANASFSISTADNLQWKASLSNYLSNGAPDRAIPIKMSSTPSVLRALGYTNRDLVITPAVIDKIMGGKHDLSHDHVEALAGAIHDPVMIVDSATQTDTLVVLTEIKTDNGNVMAAIHLDKRERGGFYHVVASAYDKNSPWMFANQIKAGKLRYLDKKKALVWARENGLQLPARSPYKGKINVLEPNDIVKWENKQLPDISFSVVGEHAKNWDELKSRAFEGRDDGKPRVELDASQSSIKPDVAQRIARRLAGDRTEKKVRFTLGDVLEYPELYAAYPKLAKMPVVLADLGGRGTRAWFNSRNKNIKINTLNFREGNFDTQALRSTLLHEVQHAIQSIEGYASGSGGENYEAYLRAGGEIESRNVQSRMDMTAAERAATPFNDTLEFPGEARVRIAPDPIEIPFNLVSGEYSSDWSALKRSSNSAHMEFVKLIVAALNKDAERMARYQELSEDERGDMAVTLMRATNLAKTAAMYLPKGWRIGLKPYLDWMEVFAEVAHTGKLDWASTAPAPYWSALMKEHLRNMERMYGIETGDANVTLEYMKDYGETRLYMLVNKLIKRVSRNLEEYGSAKIREKIEALVQSAKPKQKDNHQYKTGVMSIQSFRELARLRKMMLMEENEYDEDHDSLTGKLLELRQNEEESGTQEDIEKLESQLMELEVYGCMGMKSLDELDRMHTCLTRFMRGEKAAWEKTLEERKQRRREIAEGIVQGVTERKGPLDSTVIARARANEKDGGGRKSWLRRTFIGLQTIESLPQLLSVLEKFPDTRALAHGVRIRLGRASGRLDIMDKHVDGLFRKWGMEAFGINPKAKTANIKLDKALYEFKKKNDTGILLDRYERKKIRMPLDLARLFVEAVGMNPDGIEAGRAKLEELRAGMEEERDALQARLEEEMSTMSGSLETDKALKKVEDRLAVLDMELDMQDVSALNEWITDYDASIAEKEAAAAAGEGRMPKHKDFADVSYTRHLGTEQTPLEISRDSALYLILLSEQEDYEDLMSLHGFTPDVIERLNQYVGEGGLLLGDRMRAHLKQQGKRISDVFEALNGVPFVTIDNYFPARFKIDNKLADFDMAQMLQGMSGFRQGGATGFLAGRTRHNANLDLNLGAAAVFRDAVATSEHWMQTQDIVADFRGVLGAKNVIDALTVQFGRNSVALLKQWVHGLENLGRIDGNAKSMIDVTTSELYGSGSIAILSYKVESVIRQLSGIANMWAGDNTLSAVDWMRGLALTKSGKGGITLSGMLKSKYIKARVTSNNDIAGRRLSRMEAGRKFNVFDRGAHLGMVPIGYVDAASNALPATVLFNAHFARAKQTLLPDGTKMTDTQAREIAWDYTMAAFAQGAQPTRAWDKSHFGNVVSSVPMGKAFTFMMSENLNKLGLVSTLLRQGRYGKATGVWLAYGAMNAAIGMLLDWMRDDPEEWEERDMMGYAWAVLFGNLSGIPLVSEGLEYLIGQTGAKVYLGSAGRGVIDAKSFFSSSRKVGKMSTDENEYSTADWIKETSRLSRTFGAVGGACGHTLGSAMLYFSAIFNPVKTASDLVGEDHEN